MFGAFFGCHMSPYRNIIAADKEKFIRLLLLTAFLGQQADSPYARSTGIKIFGDDLFSKPQECLIQIK